MEYNMNKALLAACLILTPVPAFSQSASDSERNIKGDRLERLLRELGEDNSTGSRKGFGFLLRHGDSTIAVRCHPNDSMKACVEATTTLLERARSTMPPAPPAAAPK
jgi:hypothetical protein